MPDNKKVSWFQFFWRITSCHIITYMFMGLLASLLLNYKDFFVSDMMAAFMRPINSPWVAAGPSLQVFRGLLFSIILWPVKNVFIEKKNGWLKLWLLFIGFAILGTAGPSPGSFEGIIYTKLPIQYHLLGLPEVVLQTLLFSLTLTAWYQKPSRIWNILMSVALVLIVLMSIAGVFLQN